MEGNELSHSEYLKCNNVCVKVTINRYSGLCLGTLRELRDSCSRALEIVEGFLRSDPYVRSHVDEDDKPDEHFKLIFSTFTLMQVYLQFLNYMLNQNVLAKVEKGEAIDFSSLTAVLRPIVDIKEINKFYVVEYSDYRSCISIMRLLKVLCGRCDPRHPIPRFHRSLILHKFIFPVVIGAGKLLASVVSGPHSGKIRTILSVLEWPFQFTQQDFEPEEIHHGSGFVIAGRFVITNKHAIEEAMNDETLDIHILNETIGKLQCVVVHCDTSNDLALLFCPGLDLRKHGICPFALSEEALWPSLSVFSFGYPLTHTEKSALFVKGYVSGIKKRYGDNRKPFWVLNCNLNAGNSGGPVFRRIGDDIKVVGVVAQKHKKEILTLEEISILEEERSTLQMNCASDSRDQFWKSVSLKMYDALNETHCQFGYGNVVPGHVVVEFLSDPSVTYVMCLVKKLELRKIIDELFVNDECDECIFFKVVIE